MTWASDVLRYMESRQHLDGRTQKQKLLYYAQAWSLAWRGRPLFEDRIEAWVNGPVVSDFWHEKSHPAGDLDAGQKAIADAVLTHYGEKTGEELSVLGHAERPWREARGDLRRPCRMRIPTMQWISQPAWASAGAAPWLSWPSDDANRH